MSLAFSIGRYNILQALTLEQLKTMCKRGIVGKKGREPFSFGFKGGNYLGAPGKDIFCSLSSLTLNELSELAVEFADVFPRTPPGNHAQWAAAIRYVYGCFEKQGILRSEEDKRRMIEEDPDWDVPFKFMEIVAERFRKTDHKYGLVLHHEMLAHRYGDKAVIKKDPSYLEPMIKNYIEAQYLASKVKSAKHMFTPFYWAARYYFEMGIKQEAARYHKLNLEYMETYCPDSREGYREKAITSIKQMKECLSDEQWIEFKAWLSRRKNKCLKKVI